MSRVPVFLASLTVVLFLAAGAQALPKEGKPFPDSLIAAPDTPAGAQYLGLKAGAKSFRVREIASPYVLIQLFNAYCPHCMAEAPDMEKLFQAVSTGELKSKLKILGVGMGNTPFEVKLFREKYKMSMPLSVDTEYEMHSLMGSPGTPSYVLVRNAGGKSMVVFVQEGRFHSPDKFLELLGSKMKEK